ncbi:ATP-grasp domain-containing protein [Thermoflavimicrobium dichotomicum]|uniref:ATP-grasp domain-containing protein n=1 Tax=Thermoflavimicrobium dichotomicum TaxID=46223 RepID=A0A1I3JQY5_9BACL|nr:ATP-grasp domain-containing protein [Thermoflavimicrobium dichotomicum]SFI62667.1 ATP-grasp domain-containing protein [Thermoflavimicrobium dichotomicum]
MSTKTFLLTGGRAPATLELARFLHTAGHRILLAESAPFTLCQGSRAISKTFHVPAPRYDPKKFLSELKNIVLKEKVDIVLPTSEEIFTVAYGRDLLTPYTRVWTDKWEKLNTLHNKWTFVKLAQKLGLHVPQTWKIESDHDWRQVRSNLPEGMSFILKPVYSRFATRIYPLSDRDQPLPPISVHSKQPWLVQQWISGRQVCTYGVADHGRLLAHVAYQTVYTAGKGAGITFTPYQQTQLPFLVQKIVEKLHFTGQISFDWIETPEGDLVLIECNPRLTSGIHLFHHKDGLDRVFVQPDFVSFITPQTEQKRMLRLAMCTYGIAAVSSFSQFQAWLKTMFTYRDVIFRWNDPIPFFYQWLSLFYFWCQSRKHGISMTEASTHDIEWNGEIV